MDVRTAEKGEIGHLARVWYDGWHEAHAQIVPTELTRLRTIESFRVGQTQALPGHRRFTRCAYSALRSRAAIARAP